VTVKLGDIVTDSLTGFSGVAVSRVEYINGCVRIEVQPKAMHDGKPIESSYFDEQRVDAKSTVNTGGPGSVPARRDPPRS
jgi:hypothetical protein